MQVLEGVMRFEDCSSEGESCVAGSCRAGDMEGVGV